MSTYRVSVRLNLRPEYASRVIDAVAPLLKDSKLRLRNGVPGLIEGEGLSMLDLGLLVSRLTDLASVTDGVEVSGDLGR